MLIRPFQGADTLFFGRKLLTCSKQYLCELNGYLGLLEALYELDTLRFHGAVVNLSVTSNLVFVARIPGGICC